MQKLGFNKKINMMACLNCIFGRMGLVISSMILLQHVGLIIFSTSSRKLFKLMQQLALFLLDKSVMESPLPSLESFPIKPRLKLGRESLGILVA